MWTSSWLVFPLFIVDIPVFNTHESTLGKTYRFRDINVIKLPHPAIWYSVYDYDKCIGDKLECWADWTYQAGRGRSVTDVLSVWKRKSKGKEEEGKEEEELPLLTEAELKAIAESSGMSPLSSEGLEDP